MVRVPKGALSSARTSQQLPDLRDAVLPGGWHARRVPTLDLAIAAFGYALPLVQRDLGEGRIGEIPRTGWRRWRPLPARPRRQAHRYHGRSDRRLPGCRIARRGCEGDQERQQQDHRRSPGAATGLGAVVDRIRPGHGRSWRPSPPPRFPHVPPGGTAMVTRGSPAWAPRVTQGTRTWRWVRASAAAARGGGRRRPGGTASPGKTASGGRTRPPRSRDGLRMIGSEPSALRRARVGELELAYGNIPGSACAPAPLLIMGLASQMLAWPDEFCTALAARRPLRHPVRQPRRRALTHLNGVPAPIR